MKVLIIEDDGRMVEIIKIAFRLHWPEAKVVSTHLGEIGIEMVEKGAPDIVILDLGLPDISGFQVLKSIRLFSSVPIIILTVMEDENDIVTGLELGADDYIVKPFRQSIFLARVKSVIRRMNLADACTPVVCGPLRLEPSMNKLIYRNKDIILTRTEGLILHNLMRNAGKVLTYSKLSGIMWGDDYPGTTESLRVHVHRLREKIEKDAAHPQIICTKIGMGYYITEPNPD